MFGYSMNILTVFLCIWTPQLYVTLKLLVEHHQTSNIIKTHLSRQQNCWSLRCSRRCSNYIFILDLTPGINGLGKHSCKMIQQHLRGLIVCTYDTSTMLMLKCNEVPYTLIPLAPMVPGYICDIYVTVAGTYFITLYHMTFQNAFSLYQDRYAFLYSVGAVLILKKLWI